MKIKNKFLWIIFLFGVFWLFETVSYAGELDLKSLRYDVKLREDGSAEVVETWDIYVSETNTLFKTFDLDSSKYSGIRDVKVRDLGTGLEFSKIDRIMNHVTKNCFYGLQISGTEFEIAWGVGMEQSYGNRVYEISYVITDVIANYEDCDEFYWQFIGKNNGLSVDRVSGIITLPKEVENIEHLRVWAHGPLQGKIERMGKNQLVFEVFNLPSKKMLEVRVVTEEKMFLGGRQFYKNALDEILEEETTWANRANQRRRIAGMKSYIVLGVLIVCYFGILIVLFKKVLKYRAEFRYVREEVVRQKIEVGEYFREIPRQKEATPVEAGFLYYSKENSFFMESKISHIFSAMLLQLCLKGEIAFEKKSDKEMDILFLKTNEKKQHLKRSERQIYSLLTMAREQKDRVSMKELEKYARKNYDDFDVVMKLLVSIAEQENIAIGNCEPDDFEKAKNYKASKDLYWTFLFVSLFIPILNLPILIELGMILFYLSKLNHKVSALTEKGELEREQWQALKRYMEDFSLLKEKEVPDLALWEEYLVYATAFGIADKVIKQLKLVYPKYDEMMQSGSYTYMNYMLSSELNGMLIHHMNSVYNGYQSAYSLAHSSSSGSGGGFSSGGGGGRRWSVGMGRKIIL